MSDTADNGSKCIQIVIGDTELTIDKFFDSYGIFSEKCDELLKERSPGSGKNIGRICRLHPKRLRDIVMWPPERGPRRLHINNGVILEGAGITILFDSSVSLNRVDWSIK